MKHRGRSNDRVLDPGSSGGPLREDHGRLSGPLSGRGADYGLAALVAYTREGQQRDELEAQPAALARGSLAAVEGTGALQVVRDAALVDVP